MDYQKHTFSNGLRLITVPMSSIETVTVLITVGAGSRYEEKRINGISHFLEHMTFKGTKKRPTALKIATAIDGIGGESNAFTSKDHTGYYIKARAEYTPFLVDILFDILLNSKFDKTEIEKEKGVIIEEINMYEDLPMKRVIELFEKLLYGDTSLGRFIAGEKKIIRKLQREDFISYINKHYSPQNTIVTVVGRLKSEKGKGESIKKLVMRHLGDWKKKEVCKADKVKDKQSQPAVYLHYKDTDQTHLCLGVRAYHLTHKYRYTITVLTSLLGGGMSSRLFTEVREKRGLAYYVRALDERYTDVGNFAAHAGVDNKRVEEAIKVILQEFNKLVREKVKEKELKKAKEYIKGRISLGLEDSKTVATFFATSELLEGVIRTPQEIIKHIDEVTSEGLQEVARDIFRTENLNLAIIGPYKDEGRFKKLLHF